MREHILRGGRVNESVVRIGGTVRRPVTGDRTFQRTCLARLETVGFDGAPRLLGIDEKGREILSYLPGDVPADLGDHDDATLAAAAHLLRRFHDATADMAGLGNGEIACHNDFAPTNAVFRGGKPYALIDFDTLRPGIRPWDLGYAAFTWLDLGNDDHAPAEQRRRLRLFVAAYGHPACLPATVATFALARQTALAASAAARGLTEMARWAAEAATWTALHIVEPLLPSGYPPFP